MTIPVLSSKWRRPGKLRTTNNSDMPIALLLYYKGMDAWTIAFTVADKVLFVLFFISVAYLAFFSFFSMLAGRSSYKAAKRKHRFVIIFPVRADSRNVSVSVASLLVQDYPRELFDIVFAGPSVTENSFVDCRYARAVDTGGERFSKSGAMVNALNALGSEAYDMAVVIEEGNVVGKDFLLRLNDAYAAGCKAVQTHRMAKSAVTDTALLEAAGQEINNGIFRKGHVRIGLSSALAGSGMAFDLEWLRAHIGQLHGENLEKQLEILLLEDNVFIEYLNDVFIYEDRNELVSEFYNERRRWKSTRFENIRFAFARLPKALFSGNIDYCDKLFQWLIPSRTILLGMTVVITVMSMFLSWPLSLKWLGLLLLLTLSFSMGIPDSMIDVRFVKAVKTMPLLFFLTLVNGLRKRMAGNRKTEPKTNRP